MKHSFGETVQSLVDTGTAHVIKTQRGSPCVEEEVL
jgi:hypothetical protein